MDIAIRLQMNRFVKIPNENESFRKNARKLIRFENNRAKVDFLHCKNGHRDAAVIQMKTNRFEKVARKLNRFANNRADL